MDKKQILQLTPEKEEGPYYKSGSPETGQLWSVGIPGERLTLYGKVVDVNGKIQAGAWLDFWQADGEGNYDNQGFKLRGHQFADKYGRYNLETVIPGRYPGRTPHIHVKARASESPAIMTTQLFIPGNVNNQSDFLFNEMLLIRYEDSAKGRIGVFDFVI